jgi:hypothetical protein
MIFGNGVAQYGYRNPEWIPPRYDFVQVPVSGFKGVRRAGHSCVHTLPHQHSLESSLISDPNHPRH